MALTERSSLGLANGEASIDLQFDGHVCDSSQPAVTRRDGPMVVVSVDRLVSLELILFADLEPDSDIVHLDAVSEIASHIASSDVLPSVFVVDSAMVAETRVVLEQLGLDTAVIGT